IFFVCAKERIGISKIFKRICAMLEIKKPRTIKSIKAKDFCGTICLIKIRSMQTKSRNANVIRVLNARER
ncbi:MAG: hypothetical protein ACTTJ3_02750, partial [Treponema sp.]